MKAPVLLIGASECSGGVEPAVLSTDETQYFASTHFLVPPTSSVNEDPTVSIHRNRTIGDGFHEDVTVLNHAAEPLELELRLDAGADFADLFDVKDALEKVGERSRCTVRRTRSRLVPETGCG